MAGWFVTLSLSSTNGPCDIRGNPERAPSHPELTLSCGIPRVLSFSYSRTVSALRWSSTPITLEVNGRSAKHMIRVLSPLPDHVCRPDPKGSGRLLSHQLRSPRLVSLRRNVSWERDCCPSGGRSPPRRLACSAYNRSSISDRVTPQRATFPPGAGSDSAYKKKGSSISGRFLASGSGSA